MSVSIQTLGIFIISNEDLDKKTPIWYDIVKAGYAFLSKNDPLSFLGLALSIQLTRQKYSKKYTNPKFNESFQANPKTNFIFYIVISLLLVESSLVIKPSFTVALISSFSYYT